MRILRSSPEATPCKELRSFPDGGAAGRRSWLDRPDAEGPLGARGCSEGSDEAAFSTMAHGQFPGHSAWGLEGCMPALTL